tara:strand:+ start:25 stop:753 length:729 start_codon:yes stop_codon:yes gene_type:complete
MKVKSNILITLILIVPLFSFCQDSLQKPKTEYDLSLTMPGFTNYEDYRAKLEFRKLMKNKKHLKVSVYILNPNSSFSTSDVLAPMSDMDTVVSDMRYSTFNNRTYVQIGLDKYYGKNKMILVGGGLLIGHEFLYEHFTDQKYIWNSVTEIWEYSFFDSHPFFPPVQEINYGVIGIEVNIGVNIPLNQKWNIGVQASPRIVIGRSLKRTLQGDTNHEFEYQKSFVKNDYNLDISLRYSFGNRN